MLLLPLAVLAVLAIAAVLAVGRGDNLGANLDDPLRDRPPAGALPDGDVQPEDVGEIRFTMALRGYRMAEVDAVLDRLTTALASRDERIARLEGDALDAPTHNDPAHQDPTRHDAAHGDPVHPSRRATPDHPEAG